MTPGGRERRAAVEVVVMAKYPSPGAVKSRLAAAIGPEAAADLYRAFVLDLADRLRDAGIDACWAVWPPDAPFEALLPDARCLAQQGADLGERMANVARRLLGDGASGVVFLGADLPHVDLDAVHSTMQTLEDGRHDVVLGPADDGGYYLLGLTRFLPELFRDVEWGGSQVLRCTEARLKELGVTYRLTVAGFDVDEPADVIRLAALLAAGTVCLPRTAAALARAGLS